MKFFHQAQRIEMNVHSSFCENEQEVKCFAGCDPECLECDEKIKNKCQIIMFGNIHFLEYCEKHYQYCVKCNGNPKFKVGRDYFCNDCILPSSVS